MFSRFERHFAASFLVLLCVFTGFDIAEDVEHGLSWFHILEELIIMGCSIFFLATLWFKNSSLKNENKDLKRNLSQIRSDFSRFQSQAQHHIEGLVHLIDSQFQKWELTASEKEVALLLLKGLSSKEIADIRGASVKTVGQQCSSVYLKSGLSNRAELAAFFLEDLFLPPTPNDVNKTDVKNAVSNVTSIDKALK